MPVRVFQYSNIPLTIGHQSVDQSQVTNWAGSVGSYTHNYKKFSNSNKFVFEPTSITVNGDLMFDGQQLPDRLEQRLRSKVGFPDTLILYSLPNDYPPQLDLCESCEDCDCEINWLEVPAILQSVEVSKSKDVNPEYKINLTFVMLDFMSPLNQLTWRFDGDHNEIRSTDTSLNSDELKPYTYECWPTCDVIYSNVSCKFFTKRERIQIYSIFTEGSRFTSTYPYQYSNRYTKSFDIMSEESRLNPSESPCTNTTRYFAYWEAETPVSPNIGAPTHPKIIRPDTQVWGALPSSIYSIEFMHVSNITGSQPAYIGMTNEYWNGSSITTETTRIDLRDLAVQLAAKGTQLRLGDRIVIGNVNYYQKESKRFYRPAIYIRDSYPFDGYYGVLADIHPKVLYPSYAPGQIYPTENRLTFNGKHAEWQTDDYYVKLTSHHIFRRV